MKCEHNPAILIHVLTCCTHTFVNLQAFFFLDTMSLEQEL